MTDSQPLVFYDISSPLQPRSYAPNPSKSRLALSFKRVPFTTTWVEILDIPDVRKGLGCPAVRKLDDGSDFFTLPMLRDPASGVVIGDSFDIANYLEDRFPDSGGSLFPADSTRTGLDYESPNKDLAFIAPLTIRQVRPLCFLLLIALLIACASAFALSESLFSTIQGCKNEAYARFNWHIDATFTAHVALVGEHMPFNPATADRVRAMFAKRAHVGSWDDLCIRGEARRQLLAAFETALTSLARLYAVHGGGPYLEGGRATYADMIVGGWLVMLSATMPAAEWADFRTWHGGVFARLHDALQESYFVCK